MKVEIMTSTLKLCIAIIVLAPVGTWSTAHGAGTPNELRLDGLFADDMVSMTANLCGQRFPNSKIVWNSTLKEWRTSHAQKLADIQSIRRGIEHSLGRIRDNVALDWPHYAAYQNRAIAYVMYGLAVADDEHAPKLCDVLKKKYSEPSQTDEFLDQAREDGSALLKNLTAP